MPIIETIYKSDPVSISQAHTGKDEEKRLWLRIGGEGPGEGRFATLTILQAKMLAYALLTEAERSS